MEKTVSSLRRGFTIVEMLMVIAVLSILTGITVSAVSGSMKRARADRAKALCALVEQGIATYYAQIGEWPVEPGEPNRPNGSEADYNTANKQDRWYVYDDADVVLMIRKVAQKTKEGNPMMDVSRLFVARNGAAYGTDFMTAIHGSRKNTNKMKLNDMLFGYPDSETGKFRRFEIAYYPKVDMVKVGLTENDLDPTR